MTHYYTVSGNAGTTTIAARDQFDAKKQYKNETGKQATSAKKN
jgi:hypothetical protein